MGRRTPGRRAVLPFAISFEVMDADAFPTWAEAHAPGSAPGPRSLIGLDVVVARCFDRHGGLLALTTCTVDTRSAWTGPYGGWTRPRRPGWPSRSSFRLFAWVPTGPAWG